MLLCGTIGVSLHAGVTAGDDSDEKADEEAGMQGEAAGKEAYKRVQASSAAAIQRQKAVRSQVTLHVTACSVWSAPQATLPCSRHAILCFQLILAKHNAPIPVMHICASICYSCDRHSPASLS